MQPRFEIADVLNKLGPSINQLGLNTWQLRILSAIKNCITAALGGHIDACDECGNISISYNSCRNRHCPKCQGKNREDWILAQEVELLPVPYFHVVFTLPAAINTLAMQQPKMVYGILFETAWATLKVFGKNKGLQVGMIALLHTWGQNLSLHPCLPAGRPTCIVLFPVAGLTKMANGRTVEPMVSFCFRLKRCRKFLGLSFVKG